MAHSIDWQITNDKLFASDHHPININLLSTLMLETENSTFTYKNNTQKDGQ